MLFRPSDPDDVAAATRRKLDEAKAELADHELKAADLRAARAEAISDIESGTDYMKAVAALDQKLSANAASAAACRERIEVLTTRLASAEVACREKRKTEFVERIKAALPPRLRAAQKIDQGIKLITEGFAALADADDHLFRTPGWAAVRPIMDPAVYRLSPGYEIKRLAFALECRQSIEFTPHVDKNNAGLLGLIQKAALPEPDPDPEPEPPAIIFHRDDDDLRRPIRPIHDYLQDDPIAEEVAQ